MSMAESATLLRNYAETGSDETFGQLVARYFDLVYSAARRLTGGDAHLAQDVAQAVFTDLARKAKTLPPDVYLSGWLYRHTCFTASKTVRGERRRQTRERQAVEMNPPNEPSDAVWQQLAPVLEEAMSGLNNEDRDAIVMRFFERQTFRTVGETMGTGEDGARKRVERALEKLRGFFGRRGVAVSAVSLAGVLSSQAVTTAPAGLAAVVTTASLAGAAAAGGGAGLILMKFMTLTNLKIAAATVAAGMATAIAVQTHTNTKLRDENQVLRGQAAQAEQLRADNAQLAKLQSNAAAPGLAQEQLMELLQLRSQAGMLKKQLADMTKEREQMAQALKQKEKEQQQAAANAATNAEEKEKQDQKDQAIAKMNYVRKWLLAFIMYADENNGQFPTSYNQAGSFFPDGLKADGPLTTDQFDITYQGTLSGMTNPGPSVQIVLREKSATQTPDGGYVKAYAFGDGHSEIHKEATEADFAAWESGHLQKPVGQ